MSKEKVVKFAADVVLVIASAVFVYGLCLAWRPLGFIVGGLLCAIAALFVGYSNGNFGRRN